MHILFIVPYTPNLIRTRPYNLLRHLRRRGHEITLATLWENAEEYTALGRLAKMGIRVKMMRLGGIQKAKNLIAAAVCGDPLQARYAWHPALAQWLQNECLSAPDRYQIVHVEHLRGARYGVTLRRALESKQPPMVWDSVDCITHLFRQAAQHSRRWQHRWITRLEIGRTRCYERRLMGQFDRVLVTSPLDKRALEALAPSATKSKPVMVLPNGVDLEHFTPGEAPRAPATLVFTGKMSYHANITAAHFLITEVMPRIWVQRPEVRLEVVGKDPPAMLQRLGRDPRIEITGTVPDIRPYLQRATLAVAPILYGAGIQNKVLEAMACGAPVVASEGVMAALSAVPGRDIVCASSAPSFAQTILELLNNAPRRAALSIAGRQYVERHHSWIQITRQLEGVYHELIASRFSNRRTLHSTHA